MKKNENIIPQIIMTVLHWLKIRTRRVPILDRWWLLVHMHLTLGCSHDCILPNPVGTNLVFLESEAHNFFLFFYFFLRLMNGYYNGF